MMTYVQAIDYVLENCDVEDAEVVEKLEALKGRLANQKRKPKVNQARLDLADQAYEYMTAEPGEKFRVAELAKALEVSTQKLAAAIARDEQNRFHKVVEKRVSYYFVDEA